MNLTSLDKNNKKYSNNDDEPKDQASLKDNQDSDRVKKEDNDDSSKVLFLQKNKR